jgi:hypothetical protein
VQAQGNNNEIHLHLGRRETPLNLTIPAVYGTGFFETDENNIIHIEESQAAGNNN